jgi:hypothetical protein
MSAEMQQLRDQRAILLQEKEREWFDSETKRMEVEGKIMMTDSQLQAAVRENIILMMGIGTQQSLEQQPEFERLEAQLEQPVQKPQPQGSGAPAPARGAGSMTREADTEALTGEAKPGESE